MTWRALALAAALSGCALVPPRVGDPPPVLPDASAEREYRAVLGGATARAEIYAGLDARAFVGMTWQSATFREARTRRSAAFETWPEATLAEALAAERAAAETGEDFLLGVHVEDRRFDDFDRPNSAWRLVLACPDGTQLLPLSVARVGRATLPARALYPYLGDFWTTYWVRFPRLPGDGTRGFTVKLGSALGRAQLSFPAAAEAARDGR